MLSKEPIPDLLTRWHEVVPSQFVLNATAGARYSMMQCVGAMATHVGAVPLHVPGFAVPPHVRGFVPPMTM